MITVRRAVAQSSRLRFLCRSRSTFSDSSSSNHKQSPPSSSACPKPTLIPFQPKLSNSVNLIGYISQPVFLHSTSHHNHSVSTAITHHISSTSQLCIPIVFEGDLAHVAACHLKENDHVYISGQLGTTSSVIDAVGTPKVQIYVKNINFVEGSSRITKDSDNGKKEEEFLSNQPKKGPVKNSAAMGKNGSYLMNNWQDLTDNPKEWWDYRGSKLSGMANPNHPDFKRKDGGLVLWLNKAPAWVLSELENLQFDVQTPRSKKGKLMKGEESWKQLIENPTKWWDNRENKKNVKSPDFKHKETGEGLWLSNSPAWVLSKLPPPKTQRKVVTS